MNKEEIAILKNYLREKLKEKPVKLDDIQQMGGKLQQMKSQLR